MRALEFLFEYNPFDKGTFIEKPILNNRYILKGRAKEKLDGSTVFLVTVYDPKNPKNAGEMAKEFGMDGIAGFRFVKRKDGSVASADTFVDKEYQRQGIASTVYKFMKSLGLDVQPSPMQSPQGKAMWQSFRDKGVLNEVPLPPDWDKEKLNLRQTYKNRIKYALERAKRLGGGSSRVAMTIEYEGRPTVLKVAKNYKGLKQNQAELDILDDGYLGNLPIVIPLIDYDKENNQPVWIQTEVAKKITAPTLMKMLHTPSMWLFTNKVRNILGRRKPHEIDDATLKRKYFETHNERWKPTEQDYEIFEEYANEVADLIGNSSLELGDLGAAGNWGVYNGRPVIIDLGLSEEVWKKYYLAGKYGRNRPR
jgi:hypothetical protein